MAAPSSSQPGAPPEERQPRCQALCSALASEDGGPAHIEAPNDGVQGRGTLLHDTYRRSGRRERGAPVGCTTTRRVSARRGRCENERDARRGVRGWLHAAHDHGPSRSRSRSVVVLDQGVLVPLRAVRRGDGSSGRVPGRLRCGGVRGRSGCARSRMCPPTRAQSSRARASVSHD